MASYSYSLQSKPVSDWKTFRPDVSLHYGNGYLDALEGQAPRSSLRLIRSDGRVIREIAAKSSVNIGMVAGWPTAEQYERAAEEALAKARQIRSAATLREYPHLKDT